MNIWRFGVFVFFFLFSFGFVLFVLNFPYGIPIIPFTLLSFFFFYVLQAVAILRADSLKCFSSWSLKHFSENRLHGCLDRRRIPCLVHGLQITKHSFTLNCVFLLVVLLFIF